MKQWVDITTIDNNTPFTKVRWKRQFSNLGDSWFAESPGIVSDSMRWTDGTKDNGWFSAHRMNGGSYGPLYCCCFDFDHTMSGFWDTSGQTYQISVKDGHRDQLYDTTVEIGGVTYYEIDFSLWQGASGYQLYAPYSTMPWHQGDIYVEISSDPIVVDKDRLSFKSSGETKDVLVKSDNAWTATTSEAWVSLSTSVGTSGETTLSVTAPEYTSTTEDRTATITITDGEFSVTINVKQAKKREGGVSEMYLGTLNMEAAYFGDLDVEAIYLGENEVYSSGPKLP